MVARSGFAAWGCAALVAASVAACGQTEKPPLPQALVVVDTDLPVPLAVTRLRVDLYSEDGTWFDSSDFTRDDARDWPVSFGVYADEGSTRGIFVRLRAYPEGYVEPYRGERFRDWDAPLATPAGDDGPRLVRDRVDHTPVEAPLPLVTVDRLVFVRLQGAERGRVRVVLHGACVGTMAKLGAHGPKLGESESCDADEKKRAVVHETPLEPTLDRPRESLVGTWLAKDQPCDEDAPDSSTVCIPGSATLFGTVENSDYVADVAAELATTPVRIFGVKRFYVDRDEITVARVRKAIDAGYTGARPTANEGTTGALGGAQKDADCTFSVTPRGREDWAATCLSFDGARALCRFFGGDLPTEVQWEHLATVVGHERKVRFPWGNDTPTCDRSVYDREAAGPQSGVCASLGPGPQAPAQSEGDRNPLGVRRLFGNVREWVLDDPASPDDPCWLGASLVNPSCKQSAPPQRRMARGAGYYGTGLRPTFRQSASVLTSLGARCVYERRP